MLVFDQFTNPLIRNDCQWNSLGNEAARADVGPTFYYARMAALAYIVLDVNDLEKEAAFWSQLLEVEVAGKVAQYVILKPQAESGIRLSLQQVDEPKQGKNRMHVDFHVTDLAAATERAVELGATQMDEHRWPTFMWRVFQDPEGNEFCIATQLEEAEPTGG